MPLERLQKIIAASGVASRRKAEELIAAHRVTLNGVVVTEMGTKADPASDKIAIDGAPIPGREEFLYFALNKPKGFVTTVNDPQGRPTVMDLMRGVAERVYPVGRLDYASEGLLLMTNDGALAQKLTKAGSHVPKRIWSKSAANQMRMRSRASAPESPSNSTTAAASKPRRRRFASRRRRESLVRSGAHRRAQPADPAHVRSRRSPRGKNPAGQARNAVSRCTARKVSPANAQGSGAIACSVSSGILFPKNEMIR